MLVYLHLAALGLYGLSAALALAPFAGFPVASRRSTLWVAGVGAGIHAVGVAQLSLVGTGPALSVLAWCLVLLQIGSELLLRAATVALFTARLAGGLVGLALLLGLAPGAQPSAGRNIWFILHVTLSVLGLALLALAFIAAALYLLQFRELKAKRFGQVFQLFPPLERLDRLNHVALVAGFSALTVGGLLPLGYAERFAHGPHEVPGALARVLEAGAAGGVLLSTCNRTEFYFAEPRDAVPDAVWALLGERLHGERAVQQYGYVERDRDAVRHLYRVSAGLDSMVLGESQIQGQVREAWETSRPQAGAGLHPPFPSAPLRGAPGGPATKRRAGG